MNEERAAGANRSARRVLGNPQRTKPKTEQQLAKPVTDPPLFEFMPSVLIARRQWVLWRWVWSAERMTWTKVPFQTNDAKARSNDPSTWSTFEAARTAYRRGGFDGVGFVLSAGDPFVFIDFDHVLHDGELEDWVLELIEKANSYTEWSVRDGAHILVEGNLPEGKGHEGNQLAIHDRNRFVIMTGRSVTVNQLPIVKAEGIVAEVLGHSRLAAVVNDAPRGAAEVPSKTPEQILDAIRGSNQRELFFLLHESYAGEVDAQHIAVGVPRHGGKDQSPSGYDLYYVVVCRKEGATIQQALDLWKTSTLASRLSESERERKGEALVGLLSKDKLKVAQVPLAGALGSEIVPEALNYMVPGYFAYGCLHLIAGDPESGKSTFLCDLAARQSRAEGYSFARAGKGVGGPLKLVVDGGNVLFLTEEDHYKQMLAPRCIAAGADMSKIRFINDDTDEPITIPEDIPRLIAYIKLHKITLVIIEPLNAFVLGGSKRGDSDADMRKSVYRPLRKLAQETGAVVIYLQHFNKMSSEKNPMYRTGGSIANTAAARFAYGIGYHPEDTEKPRRERRRLFTTIKNNYNPDHQTWEFKITSKEVGDLPGDFPVIDWKGLSALTAFDLLVPKGEHKKVGAEDEAREFILVALSAESPMPAHKLIAQAAERGITERTLRRARERLEQRKQIKYIGMSKSYVLTSPRLNANGEMEDA